MLCSVICRERALQFLQCQKLLLDVGGGFDAIFMDVDDYLDKSLSQFCNWIEAQQDPINHSA